MLRGIPKAAEHEIDKKEVQQTDMQRYGNEMWHKATDNRDKSLVTIQAADFARLQEQLDRSGINYYAYARDNSVIMAINDKDIEWFKRIAGTPDLVPTKSNRPYSPPEKNIFGSAEYRYIPNKEYLSADRDLVLKMAEIMKARGMQFSGRVYPSGKGTLTVSHADLFAVRNIRDEVVNMRKQFAYGICINPLGEIISVFSPVKLIHPHFRDIHRIRYRRIRHKPICPSKNQNTCNNSYNLPFHTLSLPTEKAKSADAIEFSRRRIPYLCNYMCAEITSGQR